MKKIYRKPVVAVVELQPHDLIATSPSLRDGNADPSYGNLGRERDDDDDF